jgi:hypothetical protein
MFSPCSTEGGYAGHNRPVLQEDKNNPAKNNKTAEKESILFIVMIFELFSLLRLAQS